MKLAAIYNAWDSIELLRYSMKSVQERVDLFIIVFSNVSNFGEVYQPLTDMNLKGFNYILKLYNPDLGKGGAWNELRKRQIGLEAALENNCSHFLHMDCDELYDNFDSAVNKYLQAGREGSVCKIYTYFKKPTWRFDTEDGYYVPFIHELKVNTCAGASNYPYYVDPTRSINCHDVALLDVHMHHFSWVRKDIGRKVRNSSAKANIERGTMLKSYNQCSGPGYYVKDYDKKLIEVENTFKIEL